MIRLNLNEQQSTAIANAITPLVIEALGALTAAVSGVRAQLESKNEIDAACATYERTRATAQAKAEALVAERTALVAERELAETRLGR
jgi:hypothetical protein